MTILYTMLAALALGLTLNRLRVPGGMMLGAVLGASAINIALGPATMPVGIKLAAQIIAGAFIGSGVSRAELGKMRKALLPAALVISGLLLFNILSGVLIHRLFGLDLVTALMCTAPGGISDMPIAAADMGADAGKVMVMQFVRYLIGIGVFPALIGRFTPESSTVTNHAAPKTTEKTVWLPVLYTLLVATAFGLLGRLSGIPAGTMAFATVGSILFKLVYPGAALPRSIRKGAQCLSGAYVGAGMGIAQLSALRLLAGPALILMLTLALGTLVISTVLYRLKVFTIREAMLAATPAGASDMALISADLGIRNMQLVLLQVMRMISVITLFPSILHLVAQWLA